MFQITQHAAERFDERFPGLIFRDEFQSSVSCGVQLGNDHYRLSSNNVVFVCCNDCILTCLTVDQANHNLQQFKSSKALYISVRKQPQTDSCSLVKKKIKRVKPVKVEKSFQPSEEIQNRIIYLVETVGASLETIKCELKVMGNNPSEEFYAWFHPFYKDLLAKRLEQERKKNPPAWLRRSA